MKLHSFSHCAHFNSAVTLPDGICLSTLNEHFQVQRPSSGEFVWEGGNGKGRNEIIYKKTYLKTVSAIVVWIRGIPSPSNLSYVILVTYLLTNRQGRETKHTDKTLPSSFQPSDLNKTPNEAWKINSVLTMVFLMPKPSLDIQYFC